MNYISGSQDFIPDNKHTLCGTKLFHLSFWLLP
uniref:Uncharacterized protein n=1 Tax=Anguilla anguilla TaxID=7936 RepID=A0A0E9XCX0_ANGAN